MVPQESISETVQAKPMPARWRVWAARLLEIIVGAVILLAGVLKAFGPLEFAREISDYGIVTGAAVVKPMAWLFISVECVVGAALIAGFARRVFVPAAIGLLILFMGALGWAWHTGATENCGCFGSWAQRTPGQALAEDALLLAAACSALLLDRCEPLAFRRLRAGFVVAALAAGLVIAAAASRRPAADRPGAQSSSQTREPGPFTGLAAEDLVVDLEQGNRLVALIDIGCDHCQKSVPAMNQLAANSDGPTLVGLCPNTAEQVEWFKREFSAQFSIARIDRKEFLRLLDLGKTPRVFLIRDGVVVKTWDEQVPGDSELSELMPK